eukprot:scaffold1318_cov388-Prasinococcus_capsulatus_cf.AAC.7
MTPQYEPLLPVGVSALFNRGHRQRQGLGRRSLGRGDLLLIHQLSLAVGPFQQQSTAGASLKPPQQTTAGRRNDEVRVASQQRPHDDRHVEFPSGARVRDRRRGQCRRRVQDVL